ncbi:MAG TPA: lipase maturation factor family protein, partial [Candidatus Krumholzibacteria bacterium]|nr:lipase maturation factor family protein [Candidatus Krumholzibacteria bacterium]
VPLWLYDHIPGVAPLTEATYRTVARNRNAAGVVTNMLWGRHILPPGETRTMSLFLRAMGLVFAIAIISLWVQITSLLGDNGILPAHEFLDAVRSHFGVERFWLLPTVFWVNAGNVALHVVCALGLVGSLLALAGFVPAAGLLVAWAAYLSLLGVGQDFLRFQWDTLLLESGMVAILLAPWRWRLRDAPPPARPALWLARWLIFRLMVTSAIVKLTSGDPTWRNLTALDYHYFTQPLPPWTAWYAHHSPEWFHKLSVLMMYLSEGVAPFLIWGPRRVRMTGAAIICALQVLIMATGNYGFFNLLTLVLCIPLLDDGLFMRGAREEPIVCGVRDTGAIAPELLPLTPHVRARTNIPRTVIVSLIFLATLVPLAGAFKIDARAVPLVGALSRAFSPFYVANHYGLFAVMTTTRPEIIVEGSRDGTKWEAYEFRYKPGDVMRRPRMCTPHMPRLDWQMWFAALGDVRQNRWFLVLCWRLLEGSPDVRRALAHDPFGDTPPKYIRATVYMYEFTTAKQRRESGAWWTRTSRGPYVRTLMLQDGELAPAPESVP